MYITNLKRLKILKLSTLVQNGQSHDTNKQPIRTFSLSMNGYHSIYTVDLTSVVSHY